MNVFLKKPAWLEKYCWDGEQDLPEKARTEGLGTKLEFGKRFASTKSKGNRASSKRRIGCHIGVDIDCIGCWRRGENAFDQLHFRNHNLQARNIQSTDASVARIDMKACRRNGLGKKVAGSSTIKKINFEI